MGIRLATALRNARANAVTTLLDAANPTPGKIEIYTGAQPANPNTATGETLLATFTLALPSFAAANVGTINVDADPALTTDGIAAGDAGWFRALDGADNPVIDGTVSATGGGGNLELNTVTVSVDLELRITGGGLTEPVGV